MADVYVYYVTAQAYK